MVIVQYSHTEDVDDDGLDDDVLTKPLSRVKTLSTQAWCCSERPSSKGGVVMLQLDCIIPRHLPKSDPETSVFKNEEGLYHPGTSVHNKSDGFGPRECGRIASSLDIVLK